MVKVMIPPAEFAERVERLRSLMKSQGIDICFIYGDEYRKENLRYISNYWPIFERGAAIVSMEGEPIVLAAPEGEMVCREMSAWPDIRMVPDFACVTVPDEIEYPHANYTNFKAVFQRFGQFRKMAIVGLDAMSHDVLLTIKNSLPDHAEVVDGNDLLFQLRMKKSTNEIACLKEAARIADAGYEALLKEAKIGRTEKQLSAAAHDAAFREGAELIPFCLVSSGQRVNSIIGRATDKVIEDGDMVMAALSVQYQGYVATINFPFVVGRMSNEQKAFIDLLIQAEDIALAHLKAGESQSELVKAVKAYFEKQQVSQYDLYPPLHGCGVAEAESPYPNERTTGVFEAGMTVNTDISLFGHPHGSNRIEECLIVTEQGYEPMSKLVRQLSKEWKERGSIQVLK
ncbi:Xaa-Pro peptidase family protein [Paenibacillus sp. J2TS4]|uniref:M24 family metallopeptidase n=1 Tax=Paenibacillus sp. J2TS4 TaxID=2807194 RepID=UPI001B2DDE68|nr:Xaa-Pro peptidase family protein [Paenibacillus sp. J2TS4]GIP33554.1 aminopeptidase [Paenibacillus sp. J2TS4]